MYTIFIKDVAIEIGEFNTSSDVHLTVDESPEVWVSHYWSDVETKGGADVVRVHTRNPEALWKAILDRYHYIEAAGGLVINEFGEGLFIHRLGRWDLPKGKVEVGEDYPTAAWREVEEECGISDHELGAELPSTYHTYEMKGKSILKRTYWYEMRIPGRPELTPQTEEDIAECSWLAQEDWGQVEANTYPSILTVLNAYRSRYK